MYILHSLIGRGFVHYGHGLRHIRCLLCVLFCRIEILFDRVNTGARNLECTIHSWGTSKTEDVKDVRQTVGCSTKQNIILSYSPSPKKVMSNVSLWFGHVFSALGNMRRQCALLFITSPRWWQRSHARPSGRCSGGGRVGLGRRRFDDCALACR